MSWHKALYVSLSETQHYQITHTNPVALAAFRQIDSPRTWANLRASLHLWNPPCISYLIFHTSSKGCQQVKRHRNLETECSISESLSKLSSLCFPDFVERKAKQCERGEISVFKGTAVLSSIKLNSQAVFMLFKVWAFVHYNIFQSLNPKAACSHHLPSSQNVLNNGWEVYNPVSILRVYIFDLHHAPQALSINMNSSGMWWGKS